MTTTVTNELVNMVLRINELCAEKDREIARLRATIRKAHVALTKSSLTADERVYDATGVLARAIDNGQGTMP